MTLVLLVLIQAEAKADTSLSEIKQYWENSKGVPNQIRERFSNPICHTNSKTLESCRKGVRRAQDLLGKRLLLPSNDDFDAVVEAIVESNAVRHDKNFILGEMFNTFVFQMDPHAEMWPRTNKEDEDAQLANGETKTSGIFTIATEAGPIVSHVYRERGTRGLQPGDRILAVNGSEITEAGKRSINLNDTPFTFPLTLTFDRSGIKRRIRIRSPLKTKNVETRVVSADKQQFLFLRLLEFAKGSCTNVRIALRLYGPKTNGLILDLRNNPGGYADESLCIATSFLGYKIIYGEHDVKSSLPFVDQWPSHKVNWISGESFPSDIYPESKPIVVLINSASASASEILAEALKDYGRAYLVGDKSFGKGTYQTVESVNEDLRFKYTSGLFLNPAIQPNQMTGVSPDFYVAVTKSSAIHPQPFRIWDINRNELWAPPREFPDYRDPRANDVKNLKKCVEKRDPLDDHIDYQRTYSLALLSCMTE